MVVYTEITEPSNDEYRELANEIAKHRDEKVVTELSKIDPTETLYYVQRPKEISPDTLSHLLQTRIENPPYNVNFSLITGKTIKHARDLYYRSIQDNNDSQNTKSRSENIDYIFDRETDKNPSTDDPQSKILTNESVSPTAVQDIFEGEVRSLSAVLHGKHMYARLENGYLSGFPNDPNEYEFDSPQPISVNYDSNNTPHINMDKNVVLGDTLNPKYAFLDGCSALPMNMNNGLDDPIHLGLSILSNVQNFIGTFRITECTELHGTLHHKLIQAGYSAGQRAYLLNKSAATAGVDLYPYVIGGNPHDEPIKSNELQYDVTIEKEGMEYELHCRNVNSPLLDIRISDVRNQICPDTWFVRKTEPTSSGDREHYYTAFTEGNDLRIVIFSWDTLRSDELTYKVAPKRSINNDFYLNKLHEKEYKNITSKYSIIPKVINSLEDRKYVGLLTKKNDTVDSLRTELTRLNRNLTKERYNTITHFDTANEIKKLSEKLWGKPEELGGLRKDIIEEVLINRQTGALQENIYEDPPMDHLEGDALEGGCPYCDGRAYTRIRKDHFSSLARTLGICANCAYIFDIPSGRDKEPFPKIYGDLYGAKGKIKVTTRFTNPHDHPSEVVFIFSVSDNRVDGCDIVKEQMKLSNIEVNENIATEFIIDMEALSDELTPNANKEVDVDIIDYRYIGQNRICGGDGEIVAEKLEEIARSEPNRLQGDVDIQFDNETHIVPEETFEVEIQDKQQIIYGDDSFVTIEIHAVTDQLEIFSGMRTLYPDPNIYKSN